MNSKNLHELTVSEMDAPFKTENCVKFEEHAAKLGELPERRVIEMSYTYDWYSSKAEAKEESLQQEYLLSGCQADLVDHFINEKVHTDIGLEMVCDIADEHNLHDLGYYPEEQYEEDANNRDLEDAPTPRILPINMPPGKQSHFLEFARREATNIEVETFEETNYNRVRKGIPDETKDLFKSYNGMLCNSLEKVLPQNPTVENYRTTRGNNFDAIYKVLGFDKATGPDKQFIQKPDIEADVLQDNFRHYVQSSFFVVECMQNRGKLKNRLLRVKYAEKLEQLALQGPNVTNWK